MHIHARMHIHTFMHACIHASGFRRYASDSDTTLPLKGVHVVGVALPKAGSNIKDTTPLDGAACAQVCHQHSSGSLLSCDRSLLVCKVCI